MNLLVIFGSLIFFSLSLYLFSFGAKKYRIFTRLKKHGQPANAEVVEVKTNILTDTPIISFVNHNNKRQEGISRNTIHLSRFHRHRAGNKIKIFYDRNDPSIFVIDSPERLMPLFIAAIGALFMVLILYMLIMSVIY